MDVNEIVRLARLGKQAERRREARDGCLTRLAVIAIRCLVDGWMMMLLVGIIHAEWIHSLPTLGYTWAILITALVQSALGIRSTTPSHPQGVQ